MKWFFTAGLTAILGLSNMVGASPLIHYTFDEVSGVVVDRGSGTAANASFFGPGAGRSSSTPSGEGYALDLGTGRAGGQHNYLSTGTGVSKIGALDAMTLGFWINVQGSLTAGDRILSNTASAASDKGMDLVVSSVSGDDFNLTLYLFDGINAPDSNKTTNASPLKISTGWNYIAFVFDGDQQTIRAYAGSKDLAVTEIGGPASTSFAMLGSSTQEFRLGSSMIVPTSSRTPPVLIDDFRIYGTSMTQTEIDRVRLEGLAVTPPVTEAVPEPGTAALVGLGGVMLLLRRHVFVDGN